MQNKTALYVAVVILLLVFVGGFIWIRGKKAPEPVMQEADVEVTSLPEIDASVSVDLQPRQDGKAVMLTVENIPRGTESIEYELSYKTSEKLPKGALGKISLNGESDVTREILLGTCSKNVCTYDEGVTSVKLVLKFNHPEGASQFTKDYDLES